jgi:hypothetical protein
LTAAIPEELGIRLLGADFCFCRHCTLPMVSINSIYRDESSWHFLLSDKGEPQPILGIMANRDYTESALDSSRTNYASKSSFVVDRIFRGLLPRSGCLSAQDAGQSLARACSRFS